MKNNTERNGRKLNKKQLSTIKGGLRICRPEGYAECIQYGRFCGEPECKTP
ncbi:hypothetical protein [Chryseobacterium jejuense]|uniref:Uncharacterized protein n=1 Tax=Chryseobacterium jejuense TaxID=445960 RepID=A0A2X2VPN8_CHRJE|nr:hypothetical protein [Chryseobacterium jejuense]SDI85860.1 hypothetical protein SAMN05421542_2043 [Chryseobacterium jejuense]SQB27591.1 Uncharacterised protein [Chryseobacterium jejuense]